MLKRVLASVLITCFAAAVAHAAARVPQVPVSGTALATFFASQGQSIDVNTQQLDLQVLSAPVGTTFEVLAPGPQAGTNSFGIYNSADAAPPLYQIFPGGALVGWFAVASFRTAPARLSVNLFDATSLPMGTATYLGADPTSFGFYVQENGGAVFYTQDARNSGGAARILAYNGIGTRAGWTWFACETGPGPEGDFADAITLVELSLAPVPVNRSSWGRVKQLYR
jgi:hypothetical protein